MWWQIMYCSLIPGSVCQGQSLQTSEGNTSIVFVELLRGWDGLQGAMRHKSECGPLGKEGPNGPLSGGATYIRWGKSSCPEVTGTELVYTGKARGSRYTCGGGSNYLCLPKIPEYSSTVILDHIIKLVSMEQSIRILCKEVMTTLFPVLSAYVYYQLLIWSQLRPAALPPGPGSTVAI